MGKAGHRNVPLSAEHAKRAAQWLRQVAIPQVLGRPGTLLAGGFNQSEADCLEALAAVLHKGATRKRSVAQFSALVDVEQAAAFVRSASPARSTHLPYWGPGPHVAIAYRAAVLSIVSSLADAGKLKRRGRHSLTTAEIEAITSGKVYREARYVKRLIAQQKQEISEEVWFREITSRGETILTATTSPRKI